MRCPACNGALVTVEYEGVSIESCTECEGEWLDAGELPHILAARKERFTPEQQRQVRDRATFKAIPGTDLERHMACPRCETPMKAVHYGTDTGIIIDRCPGCSGLWLDGGELEKVQILVESWRERLPQDLLDHARSLHDAARKSREAIRTPVGENFGLWVNALINGMIDLA